MWVKTSTATRLTSLSRTPFQTHSVPWQAERPERCIRFKLLQLEEDKNPTMRLYLADVFAFAGLTSLRQTLNFVPIFYTGREVPAMDGDTAARKPEENGAPGLIRIELAASYLDVCRETISNRLIYGDEPVPYRIRATRTEAKAGRNHIPLCWFADVNALLSVPNPVAVKSKANRYHA